MDTSRVPAALLTMALWNSREKATVEQVATEDWKLIVDDYVNILSELTRRTTAAE